MATKKGQRIGIWIIAIAMAVGTIGSFIVMALAPQNEAQDKARLETLMADHQAANAEYQGKVSERDDRIAAELSTKYFDEFKQFDSRIASFKADGITELDVRDLREGSGDELGEEGTYAVYYMGWNPKGLMFDSSFNEDKTALKMPLIRQEDGSWLFMGGQQGNVIEGWTEGLKGVKVGGVRELTIPSDMAYGEQGSGENIPPNTPLKFIMMVVPKPNTGEEIAKPEISEELRQLYVKFYNFDPTEFGGM